MKHGSLFSGIGGFDLAAEWMGWENVFHCDWNEFGQKVLKYYWPDAISYGDITKTDFTIHRGNIDILTGGFPCQPFSTAGKRKGTEDDRHLWPEMLRAIREIQPKWIVGENVSGIINWSGGLVFEQVCADLEAEGYEVQPVVLPAVSVNAPHRRDRVWFVAKNSNHDGWGGIERESKSGIGELGNVGTGNNEQLSSDNGEIRTASHPGRIGQEIGSEQSMGSEQLRQERTAPDSPGDGINRKEELENDQEKGGGRRGRDVNNISEVSAQDWTPPDSTSEGREERIKGGRQKDQKKNRTGVDNRPERHGGIGDSPDSRTRGYKSEYWTDFPTQSPVCGRNDGLSSKLVGITFPKHRNESIKAYGNAVVPQLVYQIFKAIEATL